MTLAYLGEQSSEQIEQVESDLRTLLMAIAPLDIRFGEHVMFGKNNDIPVRKVILLGDNDDRKLRLMEAFYAKHYKVTDGRNFPLNLHVTVFDLTPQESDALSTATLTCAFIQRAWGNYEPLVEIRASL
jgi:2'-5' RNA ligase